MAKSFGVSVDFIDGELARFVRLGRLHCKIDRVGGIVETNRPDTKNAQYQATIKQACVSWKTGVCYIYIHLCMHCSDI